MIKINKVWSEDKKFKTLEFHPGLNFIAGDSSKDKNGKIKNEQRNGSGKSLSIELINFALLKKGTESRIMKVPDSILPQDSYVYINLNINKNNITIKRNKQGSIQIKLNDKEFIEHDDVSAKKELSKLCELNEQISFRELVNFLIKESGYTYSNFLSFFISNTLDKIKSSLFFFGLPVRLFEEICEKQNDYDGIFSMKSLNKKRIEEKGLDVKKIKSLKTDLEIKIQEIQNGLSYEEISKQVSEGSYNLQQEENELSDLLREKGRILFNLNEINEFLEYQEDDFDVSDKKLKSFFNNYIKGLGDFVQKDFDQLKKFRDNMSVFKLEMVSSQKESLQNKLKNIETKINTKHININKYRNLIDSGKNHLQRGLIMSNDLINNYNDFNKLLDDMNYCDKNIAEITSEFQILYNDLQTKFFVVSSSVEDSFRKTFLEIHEKVYKNRDCSFSFELNLKRNIKNKEFFKINVETEKQGSEGRNRGRQIIYDLSLLINEYTKDRSQGLLIHDRLLFGDIDNDATFNILNLLGSLNEDSFQYIGTYNTDVMTPELASEKLNFNLKDREVINLTVDDPLFYKDFKQAIDYNENEKEL